MNALGILSRIIQVPYGMAWYGTVLVLVPENLMHLIFFERREYFLKKKKKKNIFRILKLSHDVTSGGDTITNENYGTK